MSTNFRLQPPAPNDPPPRRAKARLFAVGTTLLYSVAVLVVAAALGSQLHDWARQRIVASSILAVLEETPTALEQAPAPPAAAPAAAQANGDPVAASPALPQATPTPPPINILLLGSDERPDESGPTRTDTLILLSVNLHDQSIGMLSLPRDLWVPIPNQGLTTKINTAYILGELNNYPGGGPQLAKDTVSSFIGRPVDYFVRVNFDGFREIIDLIGGIDLDVPYTIHDEQYPTADYGVEIFHLDAGLQHLDGATALKYARTRHTDGDYSRARRQQEIIRAVANKVLNAGMIAQLLPRTPQFMLALQNSIQTDIPIATGLDIANEVNGSSLKEIRQLVLDNQYGEETYSSDGAWILLPDRAKVRVAVEEFFRSSNGTTATADAPGVRVEVLNGTSQPGVAAATAELLQSQGWNVVSVGDADRKDYVQTIVINYDTPDATAQRMSTDLQLEPTQAMLRGLDTTSSVDLRVVVGNDLLPILK
jgi:polyisoprenyl-teichoic acid--peptidoglycan teichoic acid transferase